MRAQSAAATPKHKTLHTFTMAAATPCHPPMSATATLTNCYVPLPLTSESSASTTFDSFARLTNDLTDDNNHLNLTHQQNTDDDDTNATSTSANKKRGPRGLRQIHLGRSILSQSTGSSLVEWGHTKLMVSVRGPRPVNCSSMNAANNGGGLVCEGELVDQ